MAIRSQPDCQRLRSRGHALEAAGMFVLVRHGNTFEPDEKPRRIGARTDLPLTAKGLAQAHALGEHFAQTGLTFARALVSPLNRTRQTATAILSKLSSPPAQQSADFLREIDHGPDEGQIDEAVLARIGAGALAAWETRAQAPQGWTVDAEMRIAAWRELFTAAHDNRPTLVVTSNGAARFALFADPALRDQSKHLETLKLPTGGFGVIERDIHDVLRIKVWGQRP